MANIRSLKPSSIPEIVLNYSSCKHLTTRVLHFVSTAYISFIVVGRCSRDTSTGSRGSILIFHEEGNPVLAEVRFAQCGEGQSHKNTATPLDNGSWRSQLRRQLAEWLDIRWQWKLNWRAHSASRLLQGMWARHQLDSDVCCNRRRVSL